MRWSSRLAISTPPCGRPPTTSRVSALSRTATPQASSPAAIAPRRSLSLTRSSARPDMRVVPSANAATIARTGNSSIMLGTRSGGTSTAVSGLQSTVTSPTGSPPSTRSLATVSAAPISRSVSRNPIRPGLRPTPVTATREPGTMAAAASGNAAEEMSPGTEIALAVSSGSPVSRTAPPSSCCTHAPKCRSMRSVWSRVGDGSTTTVSPGVFSPASSTADFTCAEATGSS